MKNAVQVMTEQPEYEAAQDPLGAQDPLEGLVAEASSEPGSDGPVLPPRKRRWPKVLVLSALGLVAAGAAAGAVWLPERAASSAGIETVKVDRGRIVVQVTAAGTVSALKTVQVGSQVSGRVAELHADFNDQVKKGELLARLDTQLFRSAVAQARASNAIARANVSKAEAQLADAQRSLERGKALGAANFLAQEQVDQAGSAAEVARAALAGARAQGQQAAAQLQQAELNLEMTAIHSPIDGVVISRSVDVGQTVAASLQAPTIFTLAEDLRKMQVEAHVAESDVAKLAAGMPVSFTVDAFPGRKFSGKLRQVRNAAVAVQNVVTYDAIVDVDNPELELRPGMTANVTFVVAERQDVLRIPNAALRFRPPAAARPAGGQAGGSRTGGAPRDQARDPNQKMVFAPAQPGDKSQVHPVRVRVGITDGSYTELASGELTEGASLVSDLGGTTPARPAAQAAGQPPMGGLGAPGSAPGMSGGGNRRRGGGF